MHSDKKAKSKKHIGNRFKRLTKAQFLDLATKEQARYLDHFPKSSHRKLVGSKGKKGKEQPAVQRRKNAKKAEPAKPKEKEKPKKERIKKLSREDFDRLSNKEQKAYKKAFPKNSFKGKKHHVAKKKSIVEKNKTGDSGETVLTGSPDAKKKKKAEKKILKAGRDKAKSELRHSVTQESVDAIKRTSPGDLREASENLKRNRNANVKAIEETLKGGSDFDSFSSQEIDKIQRNLKQESEKEDPDLPEETIKKGKKLADRLKPDAPQELTEDELRVISDIHPKRKKKERFWQKDLKVLKGLVTGEKVEPEGRSNAMLALGVVARYALIAGAVTAVSMGAAPAALHIAQSLFEQWDSFNVSASTDLLSDDEENEEDEETRNTIGLAYDAVADYLQNVDHEEFVQSIDSTFLEFRAKASSDPYLMSLLLKDLSLVEDCCELNDAGALVLAEADIVMQKLQPLLEEAGFNRVNDIFYRGNDAVGVYASGHRSKILSLPSPSTIVDDIMETQ